MQFYDILVVETAMDFNFCLEHVHVAAFEFFEVDCFDGVSFVLLIDLDCFVDFAAETLA